RHLEVVRRAAHGAGAGARRHRRHLDPPLLGAGRRQLRAQPRPDRARPLRPARARGCLRRLAGHDRRAPARGDRAPLPRPPPGRAAAARAARRVGDRLVEGEAPARLGAEAIVARLPGRGGEAEAGRGGAVVRRVLGTAGPAITPVGLGTWAMGGQYEFGWGPADDDESVAATLRAVEVGVNWIDTAPAYGLGHAEEIVGRALRRLPADAEVLVFTKCGRRWREGVSGVEFVYDLSPESIRSECDASLRRLGVERLDLLQFHWPDH